jgi:antitoxin HicB
MSLTYRIKLKPDDNGMLLVTCPAFSELTTFGEDEADALAHARDALEEAIAARIAHGDDLPAPDEVRPRRGRLFVTAPMQTALKAELYRALREEGITRAELVRRLAWKRESVDRLFRLGHATRLDQFDAAFRALGRQVEISVSGAVSGTRRSPGIGSP